MTLSQAPWSASILALLLPTLTAQTAAPAHWEFQTVGRPTIPEVPHLASRNPIDAFVAARLRDKGLHLAPEADRATLIRRLYFVMLGVPPTPEAVAQFVADPDPAAFEHLVDAVLADARYGERWARHWLDVIRFAETNGLETNRERPNAWRFRDYVIAAYNDNVPFDRFVREQLAGDALGNDVATGFLVAGPVDIVGSPDPALTAQQRADQLDDMVATTGSAFLGLTVGCARCHAHKFDPIPHRDYYALTAVFAGVQHGERPLPPSPAAAAQVAALDARIAALRSQLAPFAVSLAAMDNSGVDATRPAVDAKRNEEQVTPRLAKAIRFTIFGTNSGEPCIDELEVWAMGRNVALATNGAIASASGTLPGHAIHQLAHLNDGLVGNEHSWIADEVGGGVVQIDFAAPERIDRIVWGRDRNGVFGDRLAVEYSIEASVDQIHWECIASSNRRPPRTAPAQSGNGPAAAPAIVRAAPRYRWEGDAAAASTGRALLDELRTLEHQRGELARAPMAYAGTFAEPKPVHLLKRGDPMQPGEVVTPGTLSLYHHLDFGADTPEQQRRLQLAAWITDPEHPLTARVLVNRVWQHQFGTGIVSTPSDFGRNGAPPSHPELLDWLARELVAGGWRLKALQRLILTSATWRQASTPSADALATDAGARLLWRFPPRRLEAEAIRDSILAVTGTLDPTHGGPSFLLHHVDRENVYHYQPKQEFGRAEARRMVYALKVRMEQDGIFGAFDCPDGSLVMPRRANSTTPLQSLNLWNSAFVLQQAAALAERVQQDAGTAPDAQIERAFLLAFQRTPNPRERAAARTLVAGQGLVPLCRALLNSNEFLYVP